MELGIPLDIKKPSKKDDMRIRLLGVELIDLIIEHPEESDTIAHYIIDENITNNTHLRSIVESNTPTLRNGML